jgi:hypothetical protein
LEDQKPQAGTGLVRSGPPRQPSRSLQQRYDRSSTAGSYSTLIPGPASALIDTLCAINGYFQGDARADELFAEQDHNGATVWRRIIDAVGQLANMTPAGQLY